MGGPSLGLLGGAGLPQGGREGGKLGVRTHALHTATRACNLTFAPRLLGQDFFFFFYSMQRNFSLGQSVANSELQ